jgi:hypothetical protein
MTRQFKIPLLILLWQSKQVMDPFFVHLCFVCSTCFPGLSPNVIAFHRRSHSLSRSTCSHSLTHSQSFAFGLYPSCLLLLSRPSAIPVTPSRSQDQLSVSPTPSHSHCLSQLFPFSFKINSRNLAQSLAFSFNSWLAQAYSPMLALYVTMHAYVIEKD